MAKKDGGVADDDMDEGVVVAMDDTSYLKTEPKVGASQDTPTLMLQEEVSINIDQTTPLIEDLEDPPPLPASPLPYSTSIAHDTPPVDDDQLPLIATLTDK